MRQYDDKELAGMIEKYNQGQLKGEDLIEFEIKLSLDEQLRNEVALYKMLDETIAYGRQKQLDQYIRRNASSRLTGNFWGKKFTLLSALGIALTGIFLLVVELNRQAERDGTSSLFEAGQVEQWQAFRRAQTLLYNQTMTISRSPSKKQAEQEEAADTQAVQTPSPPSYRAVQLVVKKGTPARYQWREQKLHVLFPEEVHRARVFRSNDRYFLELNAQRYRILPDGGQHLLQPLPSGS